MRASRFLPCFFFLSTIAFSETLPLTAAKMSERSSTVPAVKKPKAATSKAAPETHRQLQPSSQRVQEFIPSDWHIPLALQLGLPENFISMPLRAGNGKEKVTGLTYWGEPTAAKLYYSEKKLISPIFLATFSLSYIKKNGFLSNLEEDRKILSCSSITNVEQTTKGSWGSHCYLLGTGRYGGRTVPILWLESPLNHQVFIIACLSPKDGEKAAEVLWDRFLTKTKELQGESYYRAMGLDVRPGVTTYRFAGYTVVLQAERRKRDGTIVLMASTEPPGLLSNKLLAIVLDEEMNHPLWRGAVWGCCFSQMIPQPKNPKKRSFYLSTIFFLPKEVEEFSERSQAQAKKPFDVKAFSRDEQISSRDPNPIEKLEALCIDI